MRYAVWLPCDQTISYVMQDAEHETIKHPEAGLWDSREEAIAAFKKYIGADALPTRGIWDPMTAEDAVVEVPDEAEFRAREDTW